VVGSGSHSYVNQWLCGLFFWARTHGGTAYPSVALQLEVVSIKASVKAYTHQEWSELSVETNTSQLAFPPQAWPHMAAVQM